MAHCQYNQFFMPTTFPPPSDFFPIRLLQIAKLIEIDPLKSVQLASDEKKLSKIYAMKAELTSKTKENILAEKEMLSNI